MRESNPDHSDQPTIKSPHEGAAEQDLVAERTTFSNIPQKQRLSHK
jgi:hypothetical protein